MGGVAIIKVGAATETEMKEKKARVEDAMHATKAAVEEGIVPGGGIAFLRAIPILEKVKDKNEDIQLGINIVRRSLEEPLRQIANNAGHEGSIIVAEAKEKDKTTGFDAYTAKWVDMFEAGIIDPAKVTRNALQNAAATAGKVRCYYLTCALCYAQAEAAAGRAGTDALVAQIQCLQGAFCTG